MASVLVVITTGKDLELQGPNAIRSHLGTGLHQVYIDHAYLQGQHALQVQFALGAWHTGLLCVSLKWHPDQSGMRHSLVAHLIRRRCLHGKVACGPACRWPGTCVTWLEPSTSWLGQPLCRQAAWGSPPRGWRGSWKSTPCSSPCAHHWLGACQLTAPGPWANEWPCGTSRRQHCCGHGPAGTRRLRTV